MNRSIFRICLLVCSLGLLLGLCGCAPAPEAGEFAPEVIIGANAQRGEITVEGTVQLPDGAVLSVQPDGSSAARAAILKAYGNYTAMPAWCDNNGFAALDIPAQTAVVQDKKFYVSIPMGDAPYQIYPIRLAVLSGEEQPDAVNELLSDASSITDGTVGMSVAAEAVYPNEEAIGEATAAALEKAKAFIDPQLENLDKICEATAQTYTELLQNDRKLKKLQPTSENICTVTMEDDCLVMTLDSVYWDYYLHPDLEVYRPDDYRNALADGWMIPALEQCESVVQILYGHNPCGKFLADDGRVIATAANDYQVTFRENSELDDIATKDAD